MADIEVIFDPAKEYAAIVSIDHRAGWGPAMVGPNAGVILQTWVDSMPFDVSLLDSDSASVVFTDWLDSFFRSAPEAAVSPSDSPVEPMDGSPVGETPPDRTGPDNGAGEPPEPAPADADMEADASPPPTVAVCPLCAGTGVTNDGADGASITCAMCGGAKVVHMPVAR
jgi:hypothetical protein